MDFQSESEIRDQLAAYTKDKITLDEFEDWFVARSWNFQAATPSLKKIVSEIELLLAEFTSSHLSEASLRKELSRIAGTHTEAISSVVIDKFHFQFVPFGSYRFVLSIPPALEEEPGNHFNQPLGQLHQSTALTTVISLNQD